MAKSDLQYLYFTYYPKDVYPDVAMALYLVATIVLIVQIIRQKAQLWLYIIPGTAFAEALGYLFRELCVRKTTFTLYVLMTLFLLLPPNAMALANYKTVGKIISQSGARPRWFFLKPKFVNWFYFSSDIFSIALQGTGGGMMTSYRRREAGKIIVLVGLIVQLIFLACFLATTFYVWTSQAYAVAMGPRDSSSVSAKRKVLFTIVATTVLLYLRSIYRIVEFADGYGGAIYSAEWAFYVFDTLIIFLAFVVYIVMPLGPHFVRGKATTSNEEEEYDSALPANIVIEPKD
ncbi:hypothetical protein GGH94_001806 [Coemansia aciculifera]|uniref:RTA1 like protein n=1 Tax=Coemansia aciculifera TaxID=417176 RepID=A0A9W8M625_9FUNG|nr:hypothetical protein GGH94_001806 [Coemansia aciculifera]KAJ2870086.1 hypothetical protein GGH93_005839 [Coemansia aciculifera]